MSIIITDVIKNKKDITKYFKRMLERLREVRNF